MKVIWKKEIRKNTFNKFGSYVEIEYKNCRRNTSIRKILFWSKRIEKKILLKFLRGNKIIKAP